MRPPKHPVEILTGQCEETQRLPLSLTLVLLGLGVVLFAGGTKLVLIERYGTDQSYADQWVAEGMYLLRGPLYYQVDFTQIISPHGGHRPGLARLFVVCPLNLSLSAPVIFFRF